MINKQNSFDLNINWQLPNLRNYAFAFISILVCLIIIYGNSFYGEWFFDDFQNIVENANVHFKTLSWNDIKKSFNFTSVQGLPRFIAYLSFGLNYYSGGLNVFGYHVVNLSIHYIAALFLFLFIYNTLNLPLLHERYHNIAYPIALLSAFIWATNPVQVNAVTFIVQRMTSLAGMTYIMSMYFYLKGRTSAKQWKSNLFFLLCAFSALMSAGSKEIAATLPISLWLFDLFLIQGICWKNLKKYLIILILPTILFIILGIVYLKYSRMIFLDYSQWTFTLKERLLTEPRVILFYISLLLYPISSRLTMDHDIQISHSLIDPLTTLGAIVSILFIIGYALYISRRKPLISYCIIFFFLNHLIEGSFIALDLIFEHRNYLPSMLFFVPLSIFIINVLDYFAYKKSIQAIMVSGVIFLIAAQAHTVYYRNDILRYEKLLWEDNINKMPNLSRPRAALAKVLSEEGNYQKAAEEAEKALQFSRYPNYMQPALYHVTLGNYFLLIKNDEGKALSHYQQALKIQPQLSIANYGVALVMFKKGLLESAKDHITRAIRYKPDKAIFHNLLASIFVKQGDYEKAIEKANKALTLEDNSSASLAILAEVSRIQKHYERSIFYWKRFLQHEPNNTNAYFALVELYNVTDKKTPLIQTIGLLLHLKGEKSIENLIDEIVLKKDSVYVPRKNIILPIIIKEMEKAF